MKTYIVSLITEDKPGVIEKISGLLSQHGANWQASNFCQLAGQFAGIVEFSINNEHTDEIESLLIELNQEGFQLSVAEGETTDSTLESIAIEITGNDKVGIVSELSSALSKLNINVLTFSSHTESAPNWGGDLFKANIEIVKPEEAVLDNAKEALEAIASDLIVDIELI